MDRPPPEPPTGGRLQRIDTPDPHRVVALSYDAEGSRGCLVLTASGPGAGVRLVAERPRGQPASAFARRLRKELAGGRVVGVERSEGVWRVRLRRADRARSLVVDGRVPSGALLYLDADDRVLGAPLGRMLRAAGLRPGARWSSPSSALVPVDPHTLRDRGFEGARDEETARRDRRLAALRAGTRRAGARLRRKLDAIEGDARRADEAPSLRRRAEALVHSLAREDPDAGVAEVWNWDADPPRRERIHLEPGRDARAQAETWFHRAKRFERGARIAEERAAETRAVLERVSGLEEAVRAASSVEAPALEGLEAEAVSLGLTPAARTARTRTLPRAPYRIFVARGDREIRVGRSARDNDTLTLRHARPFDLWLHARGVRGAHVVVPLARNEACPAELLVDAATLAAHFSEARGEAVVEVTYAARRYVRKPRGFPPGAVTVDRERTLTLRLEPERRDSLLKNERRPLA